VIDSDAKDAIYADGLRYFRMDLEACRTARQYWRLVWTLPNYGGAVQHLLVLMQRQAEEMVAKGEGGEQQTVKEAEPTAIVPAQRKDVDDAPPARTNMERAALARGEEVREVPLEKMELLLGPGYFSHGKG
jgi:hypothetical protein